MKRALPAIMTAAAWLVIGCGDSSTQPKEKTPPDTTPAPMVYTTVVAGSGHACAIAADSTAYCWGANRYGQLGNGTVSSTTKPVAVSGHFKFIKLTAGAWHTCGIVAGGVPYCWGVNSGLPCAHGPANPADTLCGPLGGQLGDGSNAPRAVPTSVLGGLTFSDLSANHYHTCGLTTDGVAYCWGANRYGQLGDSTTVATNAPVAVRTGLRFSRIVTGNIQTCALTAEGKAYCWGGNYYGALGDSTTQNRVVPTPVAGGLTFVALAADGGEVLSNHGAIQIGHTCGVAASGKAYCWGYEDRGQLGDAAQFGGGQRNVPWPVTGGLTFQAVSAGEEGVCGVATGSIWCWGQNWTHASGGTADWYYTPAPVYSEPQFVGIARGLYQSCGLAKAGSVWCWGLSNVTGLGATGAIVTSASPVLVPHP